MAASVGKYATLATLATLIALCFSRSARPHKGRNEPGATLPSATLPHPGQTLSPKCLLFRSFSVMLVARHQNPTGANLMNLIEQAVSPLKADAIERATQEANKIIVSVTQQLAAAGNDLNIAAPFPNSMKCSREEYLTKISKYQLFSALCKGREATSRHGQPHLVDVNQERVARFIKSAQEDAAAQYEAFVAKLVRKIGDVQTATLVGNHVWAYSHLTVTKNGVQETWKTQQIVNVSKLGKLFNQWPTRKIGRKA
jgi:hypothetical protein